MSSADPAAAEQPGRSGIAKLLTPPSSTVIIAVYVISRVLMFMVLSSLFPYPHGDSLISDVNQYKDWAQVIDAGHFPVNDPYWQYPPLAGFVFWLGTHLGTEPVLGFLVFALLCDIVLLCVLMRASRRSATGSLGPVWYYVVGGICLGPILVARFDIFPTVLAVLALLTLSKPVRSGVLTGIGALLKVWPAFLIVAYPRRDLSKAIAALAVTGIVGMGLLILWGPNALSFLGEQRDRGLQVESVGALPYIIAQPFTGDLHTVFRYGAAEVEAAGTGPIGLVLTLITVLGLILLMVLRLAGRLENVPGPDVALAMVLLSIATSRVFSPQYMIWVIGIAAVCLLNEKTLMRPIAGLILIITLLGQLLYPAFYRGMLHSDVFSIGLQTSRILLLVVATIWAFALVIKAARIRSN